MAVTRGAPLETLKVILAHEYFHTWNPAHLGGLPRGPDQKLGYWFSEGVTDFYARRLAVRAGVIDPPAFVAAWNEQLRDYAASPVRTAPNSRIAKDFWSDPNAKQLPYQRGALLAAIWNARLRRISHGRLSLDDVIRAQRHAAAHPGARTFAPELFVRTARRFGLDISQDVQRHIAKGELITLPPDVFGRCATVVDEDRPVFARGFDSEATGRNGGMLHGVEPTSNAYAAGLREGMKLLARLQGEPGDSVNPYALRVDDGGTIRVIRYLPQGAGKIRVQQVRLAARPPYSCARDLGGASQAADLTRH